MEQWNPCDTQPFGDYHERNKAGTEAQRNMGNKGTWGTGGRRKTGELGEEEEQEEQGETGNMRNGGKKRTKKGKKEQGDSGTRGTGGQSNFLIPVFQILDSATTGSIQRISITNTHCAILFVYN